VAWSRERAAALELGEHARHAGAVGHEGDERQDGGRNAKLTEAEGEKGEVTCGEGEVEGWDETSHGCGWFGGVEMGLYMALEGGEVELPVWLIVRGSDDDSFFASYLD
jgi:hypothetical protein